MKIEQRTFPDAINVISLATAKSHLRVEHSSDDALITSLITASQDVVQKYTGTFLQRTSSYFYFDDFQDMFHLHSGPDVVIDKSEDGGVNQGVSYINPLGGWTVVDSSTWQEDGKQYPSRLRMMSIPTDVKDELNRVRIPILSGYDTDNRPQALVSAMLLIIGHLYENRQDVTRFKHHDVPMASRYLMDPYRLKSFK